MKITGAFVLFAALASAQTSNDYSKNENWLCRPGVRGACDVDLSTTVVAADGTLTKEAYTADPNAPIDCFYVYPTVSNDPTPNSDMEAGPEELSVVRVQFARFGSQCRLYAPLYRQVTLTALRAAVAGKPMAADRVLAYRDVVDAWNYYLKHDNQGRGVVLIGHSQGSGILAQVINREIDGKPVQSRIVSALLMGATLSVPVGKNNVYPHMPLCRSASQTGCVIIYASFRANTPPPDNSRFGRVREEGFQAACTNPAALAGGSGALRAYLTARGRETSSAAEAKPWVTPEKPIDTPFVSVPGLLRAECVVNEHGSYLAVTIHGDPQDPRTDDIAGDVVSNGRVLADWGLHLIDVNLALGNLLDIVHEQSRKFVKKR